ncbi:ABC-three component system protein [Mycoplasma yeatsii]|uniref:ABC-three component system protein n=1 Tax=Mycoplasma yeatsii TaxID=51365 RepID=UPI0005B24053|nr:ABC-three component system protein [Mycoplasma yeatsii]AJM72051.1 hypothetical protein MYE_02915 [Mycoplasma yeatsii GM274B]
MGRETNLNSLILCLDRLQKLVNTRNSLNLYDLNTQCETIYKEILNVLFGWELENANITIQHNCPGFDLIDIDKKILIQVSSEVKKDKIEKSLNKNIYKKYANYSFKFLGIIEKIDSKFKNIEYENPYNLKFNPKNDIIDHHYLISQIHDASIEKQEKIISTLSDEIRSLILSDTRKVTTILADLINHIHQTSLAEIDESEYQTISFEIEEKISFNKLKNKAHLVNDYFIYHNDMLNIYEDLDIQGNNKSRSVLQKIRKVYHDSKKDKFSPDEIFGECSKQIKKVIIESENWIPIDEEPLEMYIDIILVDAFVRCKIFENPEKAKDVVTR